MEQQVPVETQIRSLWPDDDDDVPASKSSVDLSSRVWRRGDLLVMDRHARLPDICLLTGQPATQRVEREVSFYPNGSHLALLLGIVPYLAALMCLSSTVRLELGLCEQMFQRQRYRILFGKILGGIGAAAIMAAIAFGAATQEHEMAVVMIAVGAVVGIAGLVLGFVGSWPVIARKIDTDYVWLTGVHPEFLAKLPEWPRK